MANDTPESDFSIECFQNYSAPEVFVQGLAGMVNQNDVESIIRSQKVMLQRFEKTTEMLTNCNQLSASRLKAASAEFKKHTILVLDMKKDLEFIFKKIRAIKTKLSTQYPEAYKLALAASVVNKPQANEDNDDNDPSAPAVSKSKMLATASTETLRPVVYNDKRIKRKDKILISNESSSEVNKLKRSSSSSETESASSGEESSTDTG